MNLSLLSYTSNNIGDDIQSYALAQHIEKFYPGNFQLSYHNRSHLDEVTGSDSVLLYNGFRVGPPPHRSLKVKYLALADTSWPHSKWSEEYYRHYSENAPIGCRDLDTFELMESKGIEAFYTGCPSVLIPYKALDYYSGDLVCVDVDPTPFKTEAIYRTNNIKPEQDRNHFFYKLKNVIMKNDLYSPVVTNRIHITIPRVALGLPTIFVKENIICPWRLSALPEHVTQYRAEQLHTLNISKTSDFIYDVADYKTFVEETTDTILKQLLNEQ